MTDITFLLLMIISFMFIGGSLIATWYEGRLSTLRQEAQFVKPIVIGYELTTDTVDYTTVVIKVLLRNSSPLYVTDIDPDDMKDAITSSYDDFAVLLYDNNLELRLAIPLSKIIMDDYASSHRSSLIVTVINKAISNKKIRMNKSHEQA